MKYLYFFILFFLINPTIIIPFYSFILNYRLLKVEKLFYFGIFLLNILLIIYFNNMIIVYFILFFMFIFLNLIFFYEKRKNIISKINTSIIFFILFVLLYFFMAYGKYDYFVLCFSWVLFIICFLININYILKIALHFLKR